MVNIKTCTVYRLTTYSATQAFTNKKETKRKGPIFKKKRNSRPQHQPCRLESEAARVARDEFCRSVDCCCFDCYDILKVHNIKVDESKSICSDHGRS